MISALIFLSALIIVEWFLPPKYDQKIKAFETYDDQKAAFSKGGFDPRKVKHVSIMKLIKDLNGFYNLQRIKLRQEKKLAI